MIRTLRKFFDFCGEENKKLFIASIWLGVLSAVCSAMRIPAVYIVIQSLLEKNVTIKTLMSSFAVILLSVICSFFTKNFGMAIPFFTNFVLYHKLCD